MLEAWRYFRGERQSLADYWATPVYELWLEDAVNAGIVDAPDFYANRALYCKCRWIGAGRGWVDPVKEAQAAMIRMDSGLSTLEAECAEQGLDWEEVLQQQAKEMKMRISLGLPMPVATKPPPGEAPGEAEEPEDQNVDPDSQQQVADDNEEDGGVI